MRTNANGTTPIAESTKRVEFERRDEFKRSVRKKEGGVGSWGGGNRFPEGK